MRKLRRAVTVLGAAILLGLGIFLGVHLSRMFRLNSEPRIYSTPALLQQVQTLSQLVTVQYIIEKVEVLEVPSDNVLGKMVGSENRVLLLAHGIVKAGIDFSRLKPDNLQVDGSRIVVKLPYAQITDAYLDEGQSKVIDRTTGLLAPPDKDLEQTARQNALDDITRAARTSGILKDADDRARTQLANLFFQLGFKKVEFQSPWGTDSSIATRQNVLRAGTNLIDLKSPETSGRPAR